MKCYIITFYYLTKARLKEPVDVGWNILAPSVYFLFMMNGGYGAPEAFLMTMAFYIFQSSYFGVACYYVGFRDEGYLRTFGRTPSSRMSIAISLVMANALFSLLVIMLLYFMFMFIQKQNDAVAVVSLAKVFQVLMISVLCSPMCLWMSIFSIKSRTLQQMGSILMLLLGSLVHMAHASVWGWVWNPFLSVAVLIGDVSDERFFAALVMMTLVSSLGLLTALNGSVMGERRS